MALHETDSFPQIDTPDFSHDQWLRHLESKGEAIGNASGTVAIIGAGPSGVCAAVELMKAGVAVHVFEQKDVPGGRCDSINFPSSRNKIELGAMRFPPTEFVMSYYLKQTGLVKGPAGEPRGIDALDDFPDPGVTPTWLLTEQNAILQTEEGVVPEQLKTVYEGWNSFLNTGLTQAYPSSADTLTCFAGPLQIQAMLQQKDVGAATNAWRCYISSFQGMSLRTALQLIFAGPFIYRGQRVDIPGGNVWAQQDFNLFGTFGIGAGGFATRYSSSFLETLRMIINGFDCPKIKLKEFPLGIRRLPEAMIKLPPGGVNVLYRYPVTIVKGKCGSGFRVGNSEDGLYNTVFDRVIFATTTRSMELMTNLTDAKSASPPQSVMQVLRKKKSGGALWVPQNKSVGALWKPTDSEFPTETAEKDDSGLSVPDDGFLLAPPVGSAVRTVHVTGAIKIAAQIHKFWEKGANETSKKARALLVDGIVREAFTIDYGEADTAVCVLSCVFDGDEFKQQGVGVPLNSAPYGVDKFQLYHALQEKLRQCAAATGNTELQAWVENLTPYPNKPESVAYVEWQRTPFFSGAFKLAEPGQEPMVQEMYFDYQKAGTAYDTGVYLAGDCIHFSSGWVEAALHTGLNAAAAVITSMGGTVNPDSSGTTPMNIKADRYEYSGELIDMDSILKAAGIESELRKPVACGCGAAPCMTPSCTIV